MLDRLDPEFALLEVNGWHLDCYDKNGLDFSLEEAKSSDVIISKIEANYDVWDPSKILFWIDQKAGKAVNYSCLIQYGRNINHKIDGQAPSIREAISALNKCLKELEEELLLLS